MLNDWLSAVSEHLSVTPAPVDIAAHEIPAPPAEAGWSTADYVAAAMTRSQVEELVVASLLRSPRPTADLASKMISPEFFSVPALRAIYESAIGCILDSSPDEDILMRLAESKKISGRDVETAFSAYARAPYQHDTERVIKLLRDMHLSEVLRRAVQSASELDVPYEELRSKLLSATADAEPLERDIRGAGDATAALGDILSAMDATPEGRPPMIESGLRSLDAVLATFRGGKLCVIAGRPGNGKSAASCRYAIACSRSGLRVDLYSWEMSPREYVCRIASMIGGVAYAKLEAPEQMDARERERMRKSEPDIRNILKNIRIFAHVNAEEACMRIAQDRPHLAIIDYVQAMAESIGIVESSRRAAVDRVIVRLFTLTRKVGVNIIALAQLHRPEDRQSRAKMPSMDEIKESGKFEEAADIVQIIYWPTKNGVTEDDPQILSDIEQVVSTREGVPWSPEQCYYRINVAKQRSGECRDLDCVVIPNTNRFYDMP